MTGTFDGQRATAAHVLQRAHAMPGRTFGDLVPAMDLSAESGRRNKGSIGMATETYFGLEANSLPEPDFRTARIELKTVPLRPRDDELVVKERVYIGMIDYRTLDREEWAAATVRRKLDRILFVFYQWRPGVPLADSVVTDVVLWEPTSNTNAAIKADWLAVRNLVRSGRAEDISESIGSVLVAATKGPGGPPDRSQPHSDVPARSRAWALRPSFLASLVQAHRASASALSARPDILTRDAVEALRRLAGLTVADVESRLALAPSPAKNRANLVFQHALEEAGVRRGDLAAAGVDVRVVQADDALRPYEALSFPAFRYQELIREDWEDSELLGRLNRILFIPVIGGKGLASLGGCRVSRAFVWAPSDAELSEMALEWTMFRNEIEAGNALHLTPASRTKYLHVRPKGKTGLDTDPAPLVGAVVKKCFWFNKPYVTRILQQGAAQLTVA